MRILWITNLIFPAPSKALGISEPVFGGWMFALAKRLNSLESVKLAIATIYDGKDRRKLEIDGVVYYLLPSKTRNKYQKSLELHWAAVCEEFNPNLIHIHGTEHLHALACLRACPDSKYVVSIQGLVSACSRYFFADISRVEVFRHITFRDCIKADSLFQESRRLRKRVDFEKEYFLSCGNVIGRTSWDFAHIKAISPKSTYYFCDEILRDGFYSSLKWNIHHKNQYSIFLSQAILPFKGLHQVIRAISLLKSDFPLIKLRIAGPNILQNRNLLDRIKMGGYGHYIQKLIDKFDLQEHILFTGSLSEQQMVAEYRNAHIFICPSSIENSPNSLGEAQLLGVPTISAYVGGIPDMVTDGESGLLYRFEEIEMLAQGIRKIFLDDEFAVRLSKNGIKAAERRHSRQKNLDQMIEIYSEISHVRSVDLEVEAVGS